MDWVCQTDYIQSMTEKGNGHFSLLDQCRFAEPEQVLGISRVNSK